MMDHYASDRCRRLWLSSCRALLALIAVSSFAAHAQAFPDRTRGPLAKASKPGTPKSLLVQTPRTVFVQMFEWPWKDIGEECERYLGPNGFAAVQVSPPTEHMVWDGSPWWERYQPVSYQLVSRSGTEAEFREMIQRCHNVGVDIYVDVVINHMAGIEVGTGHAGTRFKHKEYPGLYSEADFHACGRHRESVNTYDNILDYNDRYEVQNCEMVNLADLATEKPYVQDKLAEYLNRLLALGADGFRIDAAKHIPANDLNTILSKLSRWTYIVQELIANFGEPISPDEYMRNGDYSVFNYAYDLGHAFHYHELWKLQGVGWKPQYPDSTYGVVFLENHDLQRTWDATGQLMTFQGDPSRARLAQVFMLGWPYGYPQIFSSYKFTDYNQGPPVGPDRNTLPVLKDGQCQAPWICEHRSPEVAPMVQFRNMTDSAFYYTNWWANGDQLAFGRGDLGFVVINSGDLWLKQKFQTSLPPGIYCNILDPSYDVRAMKCTSGHFRVESDRTIWLEVPPRQAAAFHYGARIAP